MSDSNIIDLNIALLPDAKVGDIAILLSQKIARVYPVNFTLDATQHLPHLSLYHGRYPQKNFKEIVRRVEHVVKLAIPFPIILDHVTHVLNFVFLVARGSGGLSLLQSMLIENLNPLREGNLLPDYQALLENKSSDPRQLTYIRRYGYPHVLEQFMPHITLTRLIDEHQVRKAMALVPNELMTFSPTYLIIGNIGRHGTCPKIINNFPLRKRN